jgi:transposase
LRGGQRPSYLKPTDAQAAQALVLHHDPVSREVVLHPRLHAFANHWRFGIRACAPYRARTKGKDERGVGYVKSNAIAGRRFASWSELEAHLAAWTREVADVRVHSNRGQFLAPLRDQFLMSLDSLSSSTCSVASSRS